MNERLTLSLVTSAFLVLLFCQPQTLNSLQELSYGTVCVGLAASMGLTVKFSASKLGLKKPSEQAAMLDEFIGGLLVRRSRFRTFTRICLWNILVSFVIAAAGFLTMGALPIVWAFLGLGLFSPDINIFKRYLHSWLETVAVVLSASLGIWGGQNLNLVLMNLSMIPPTIIILILGLHVFAAVMETSKMYAR